MNRVFQLNSTLFWVYQPDTYWTFDRLLESVEMERNEWHEKDKLIKEVRQPPLFEGDILYKTDPDWKPGRWELDYTRIRETLAKVWVDHFNSTLKYQKLPGYAEYSGHGSPEYYNYGGDWADFDFAISKTGLRRLYERVLGHREAFAEYLKKYHSSRDGYMSFCTNDIDRWEGNFRNRYGDEEYKRAIWQALDFAIWPTKDDREEWNSDYDCSFLVEDFDDTWVFVEEESEEMVVA